MLCIYGFDFLGAVGGSFGPTGGAHASWDHLPQNGIKSTRGFLADIFNA